MRKRILLILLLSSIIFSIPVLAQTDCGTVTDADGHTYTTIVIGTQCWMRENINVGSMITAAAAGANMTNNGIIEKYCYNNNPDYCDGTNGKPKLGGLYEWKEAAQYYGFTEPCAPLQGICPLGWHFATSEEWMIMEEFLGMCSGTGAGCSGDYGYRGTTEGDELKKVGNCGGRVPCGTSFFDAELSGRRMGTTFDSQGSASIFWSHLVSWWNVGDSRTVMTAFGNVARSSDDMENFGYSIRCIQGPAGLGSASAGSDQTICSGQSATLTATGGGTYVWNTAATTASITVSPTTSTTYTVTVTLSGCTGTDAVIVVVNPSPTVNAGTDKTICNGQSTTLTASGSGGSTYVWSTAATTTSITVSPTTSTTYTVTVTLSGCTGTDAVIVNVNPLPTANAGTDKTICNGQSTTLTASGGGTYVWNTAATTVSITVSPTTSTTYTVTVTLTGCTATDVAVVIVNPLPTASAGGNQTICSGTVATLTAGGGGTYTWNTLETNQSITVNPASTTTYTVTVTNGFNCTDTEQAVITVTPLPTADAGAAQTICDGKTATLTASGGGTYVWNTNETTTAITVNPASTTTYTVTVTLNGCTDSDETVVTVNPVPTADAGIDQTICDDVTATLTASGGLAYEWSTLETTASITVNPNTTTTYTVTVTNGFNCTDTDEVIITVNPLPTADAGTDISICNGSSTTLNATGGTTYEWNTGETTDIITVNPTVITTYTVTVTDANNCTDSDEVIVSMGAPLVTNAGLDTAICIGDSITLTASGAGVKGTYVWSTGDSVATIWIMPLITTTYTVTATDSTGCTGTDDIVVTVNPLPTPSAGKDDTICRGKSKSLIASGGTTYVWSTAQTAMFITVSPTITTTYTVTATNFYGCTNSDEVVVYVNPLPPASAGNDISICNGVVDTLTASGGTIYVWNTGETTVSITINPNTTTTYTVTVTDTNGCSNTDNVVVTIYQLPPANAGNDISICDGNTDTLTAGGGTTYEWNTGETTVSITVNPNITTTYTVTVTDANNCSNTDEVVVTVNSLPTADAGTDITICYGDTDTLTASGGVSYVWSNSYTTNQITVNPQTTTTYIVTTTDINGCTDEDTVIVIVNSLPSAYAGLDTAICLGDTATLVANGGAAYEWSTGATTDIITVNPTTNTTYTITVTDIDGCSNTDEVIVTVNPLPNAPDVSDEALCDYIHTVTFTVNNSDASYTYLWYNLLGGNPLTCSNNGSIITINNVTIPDTFYVRSMNNFGCLGPYTTVYVTAAIMPVADFTVEETPPYYEGQVIQFNDQSTNADDWLWIFGDNETSTDQNPEHAYTTEGVYTVTLIVCTQGMPVCCDTLTKADYMNIYKKSDVFVPAAFTPNGDNQNDVLKVLGENITKLEFRIYNQWGILLFETTDQKTGWDGTFEGNPQPEGNYVYLLEAQIADGRVINKQGVSVLLR